MFSKLLSILIFVLMFTSIDCQSNDSICGHLFKEGRLRDFGLYRLYSEGSLSYRLFSRDFDYINEYQLEINNWTVSAQPSPIIISYGVHKFYGGYGFVSQKKSHFNCRVMLTGMKPMRCVTKDRSVPNTEHSTEDTFVHYNQQIVVSLNREIYSSKPIAVFNRLNKSSVFYYWPLRDKDQRVINCTECHVPKFVEKMDPQLFTRIQGVVPFNQSEESYLILFNISDVLQYCFTEETEVWHNFDFDFN